MYPKVGESGWRSTGPNDADAHRLDLRAHLFSKERSYTCHRGFRRRGRKPTQPQIVWARSDPAYELGSTGLHAPAVHRPLTPRQASLSQVLRPCTGRGKGHTSPLGARMNTYLLSAAIGCSAFCFNERW